VISVRRLKKAGVKSIIDSAALSLKTRSGGVFVRKAELVLPLVLFAAAYVFVVGQPAVSADAPAVAVPASANSVASPGGAVASPKSAAASSDEAPVAAPSALPSGYAPVTDKDYRIKEEDYLKLDVWGETQLTNVQLLVTPDGNVSVPFLGTMQAKGLTAAELTAKVVQRFEQEEIFIDPKVQIAVMTLHQMQVRVSGEVNRPGDVNFREGDRLLDAIASAGSYRETAWLEKGSLMRQGSDTAIPVDFKKLFAGDLTQNYLLQKGDLIYIPPENYENKIYVLGFVQRPGIYSLKDRTTVLSAISLANGATERGSLKGTVVVRGDMKNPTRVPCNLTKLFDKGDLSQDVVLEAGDVVIVPETNKPNWNQISSILGTIMNLTYLRRYGLF
jgi:polysaccharide export outer membrane protein